MADTSLAAYFMDGAGAQSGAVMDAWDWLFMVFAGLVTFMFLMWVADDRRVRRQHEEILRQERYTELVVREPEPSPVRRHRQIEID